jgi:hypothetical protein
VPLAWSLRCQGHFAAGRGSLVFPSAAISIVNDGFGALKYWQWKWPRKLKWFIVHLFVDSF